MAHYFHLTIEAFMDKPLGLQAEYRRRLKTLPPIGGFIEYRLSE